MTLIRLALTAPLLLFVTVTMLAAPSSPTNLQAVVSGSTVSLTWTPSPAASGYRLEAGSAPGLSDLASSTLAASATYTVSGVPAGVYYVRVRALDASGASAPSNEIVVAVGGGAASCFAPPDAPTRLRASIEGPQVALSWSPAPTGCAATAYIVRAGSAQGAADLAQITVPSTSFSAVAPDGVYFVSVVAINAFGASAPSGGIVLPVAAPTAGGRVGFNTATPAIAVDGQGNAVIIGEVVNRSLTPAVFIEVSAVIRDPNNQPIGSAATFLRGQPRRLTATGIIDDSALAPGEIGCFYLQTSVPATTVGGAGLQLTHDVFPTTPLRSKVSVVDIERTSGPGSVTISGTVANTGAESTFFNVANFYMKRADGRAVGCDFAFVPPTGTSLAPGQAASFTTLTHASGTASTITSWMQWQEPGDPLSALAVQTYDLMLRSDRKRDAIAAWEALQQQRRALARQVGR